MTPPMLLLAIATSLAGVLIAWRAARAHRARLAEEAWLPDELRNAELAFAEKTFRSDRTGGFVARIDRGYRVAGELRLVEFKTRSHARPYPSDIIELSVQRLAIEEGRGERVSDIGYVLAQNTGARRRSVHRVRLLPKTDVVALARRREDILSGRVAPLYPPAGGLCRDCSYRTECRAAHPVASSARR